jgi:hypothetical protein
MPNDKNIEGVEGEEGGSQKKIQICGNDVKNFLILAYCAKSFYWLIIGKSLIEFFLNFRQANFKIDQESNSYENTNKSCLGKCPKSQSKHFSY